MLSGKDVSAIKFEKNCLCEKLWQLCFLCALKKEEETKEEKMGTVIMAREKRPNLQANFANGP